MDEYPMPPPPHLIGIEVDIQRRETLSTIDATYPRDAAFGTSVVSLLAGVAVYSRQLQKPWKIHSVSRQ